MTSFWILIPLAYLAGSINFSILLFKLTGRSDPREAFSGNPGTTNVFRLAGPIWAILVLMLDFSRAMGVAWAALTFLPVSQVPWVGLALIAGNRYPCFHSFNGGKGVANYLGFFAMLTGVETLYSLLAWLLAYGAFRKPFIASFSLVLSLAWLALQDFQTNPVAVAGTVATVLFIIINHRRNMIELLRNNNPRRK